MRRHQGLSVRKLDFLLHFFLKQQLLSSILSCSIGAKFLLRHVTWWELVNVTVYNFIPMILHIIWCLFVLLSVCYPFVLLIIIYHLVLPSWLLVCYPVVLPIIIYHLVLPSWLLVCYPVVLPIIIYHLVLSSWLLGWHSVQRTVGTDVNSAPLAKPMREGTWCFSRYVMPVWVPVHISSNFSRGGQAEWVRCSAEVTICRRIFEGGVLVNCATFTKTCERREMRLWWRYYAHSQFAFQHLYPLKGKQYEHEDVKMG